MIVSLKSTYKTTSEKKQSSINSCLICISFLQEIQGQCFLFLLAGYETTSTLLAFVAYRLVIHPELQEKIYTEIKQHFDDEVYTQSCIGVAAWQKGP